MVTQSDWQKLYTQQLAAALNTRFGNEGITPKQLQGFINDVLNEALEDKILSRSAEKAEADPRNTAPAISHQDAWAE